MLGRGNSWARRLHSQFDVSDRIPVEDSVGDRQGSVSGTLLLTDGDDLVTALLLTERVFGNDILLPLVERTSQQF